jgi:pSer/pThr/pTyr-binding forkhead associated (FHA) protein
VGAGTTSQRGVGLTPPATDSVYAEIRYQDDSGAQVYLMTRNEVRIGRGGGDQAMDIALYTTDEVSREHLIIRREPATGLFTILDVSTNGSWLDGKRLSRGVEELLPASASLDAGKVIQLTFEARR